MLSVLDMTYIWKHIFRDCDLYVTTGYVWVLHLKVLTNKYIKENIPACIEKKKFITVPLHDIHVSCYAQVSSLAKVKTHETMTWGTVVSQH